MTEIILSFSLLCYRSSILSFSSYVKVNNKFLGDSPRIIFLSNNSISSLNFLFLFFPLVMLLGRVFYGERLTKNKVIGMGVIMLGVAVFYL